jgi:hypothetical protein
MLKRIVSMFEYEILIVSAEHSFPVSVYRSKIPGGVNVEASVTSSHGRESTEDSESIQSSTEFTSHTSAELDNATSRDHSTFTEFTKYGGKISGEVLNTAVPLTSRKAVRESVDEVVRTSTQAISHVSTQSTTPTSAELEVAISSNRIALTEPFGQCDGQVREEVTVPTVLPEKLGGQESVTDEASLETTQDLSQSLHARHTLTQETVQTSLDKTSLSSPELLIEDTGNHSTFTKSTGKHGGGVSQEVLGVTVLPGDKIFQGASVIDQTVPLSTPDPNQSSMLQTLQNPTEQIIQTSTYQSSQTSLELAVENSNDRMVFAKSSNDYGGRATDRDFDDTVGGNIRMPIVGEMVRNMRELTEQ